MTFKTYEIIAAPVKGSDVGWRIVGDDRYRQVTDSLHAKEIAVNLRGKGMVVIIRPQFNEVHLGRHAFREWRSFDGGLFTEIHWLIGKEPQSQVRLDDEVVLP